MNEQPTPKLAALIPPHDGRPRRSPEAVLHEAREHFTRVAAMPYMMDLSPADCETQARLGVLLVEACLELQEGALLGLTSWFQSHAQSDDLRRLAIGTLPYIVGALQLLDMEFAHDACGVLPPATVRTLIDGGGPVVYQGVTLTCDTVKVQYRRLAL